jgi:hypothetical protein
MPFEKPIVKGFSGIAYSPPIAGGPLVSAGAGAGASATGVSGWLGVSEAGAGEHATSVRTSKEMQITTEITFFMIFLLLKTAANLFYQYQYKMYCYEQMLLMNWSVFALVEKKVH